MTVAELTLDEKIEALQKKFGLPNLSERIAALLKAPAGVSAKEIAENIEAAKISATCAENSGKAARLRSVDPTCVDGVAERGRAEDFEFSAQRFRNAIEALTPHLQAAQRREELERWKTNTTDIRQRVFDLGKELKEVYPQVVATLVDLFRRCEAADREAATFNGAAPFGCYIPNVEEVMTDKIGTTKIIPKVKLPTLTGTVDAWPLPTPPLGVAMYDHVLAMMRNAPPPPTEEERAAESARLVAFGEERERGRVRMNEEAEARARAHEAERRRLQAGELPR
jgi:hypothetical protein